MNQFYDGFASVVKMVHLSPLDPYELGQYAAAGTIGALCGILFLGGVVFMSVSYEKVKEKVKE